MTKYSEEKLLQEFKPIFYPGSIAVVGASSNPRKAGHGWIRGLLKAGYRGGIYPVNRQGGEMLGLKIYPSLKAIPGPVDYVIVSIPREMVPDLLDDCAAKKVKAVHFFTAGYSEVGDASGKRLEEEMVSKARQGGFRIIGPNCIGTYCPESRIPYGPPGLFGEGGPVAFVSQSGGIGLKLAEMGIARSIKYSKGVSFGNGVDLDGPDFLNYLAADPGTSIVGAYLEGTRNGSRLFDAMKNVSRVKPLVVWKGGRTAAGAVTAGSHTGSLASNAATWSAAMRQAGVIEVPSVEELTDALLIFQQLQRWRGKGVAIVGGLADGGGGICVSSSDVCAEVGLNIPPLSAHTRKDLTRILGQVGSILHNPVDVSQANGSPEVLRRIFTLLLGDPAIDLLIVQQDMGILTALLQQEHVEAINRCLIELRTQQSKPIVVVMPPGLSEEDRLQMEDKLSRASIPVFLTMERAAKAILRLGRYSRGPSDERS